jgi:hypothetical protein
MLDEDEEDDEKEDEAAEEDAIELNEDDDTGGGEPPSLPPQAESIIPSTLMDNKRQYLKRVNIFSMDEVKSIATITAAC